MRLAVVASRELGIVSAPGENDDARKSQTQLRKQRPQPPYRWERIQLPPAHVGVLERRAQRLALRGDGGQHSAQLGSREKSLLRSETGLSRNP